METISFKEANKMVKAKQGKFKYYGGRRLFIRGNEAMIVTK
jgi:hypothetical protein